MRRASRLALCALALSGCGSSSSSTTPSAASSVSVRFAEGAPELETLIGGVPSSIGSAYLQVDGKTVASVFNYGTFTSFLALAAGAHSLVARDLEGYAVGPIPIPALTGGDRYTLILVGSYPNYSVLAFPEPASAGGAQLSLYEASPTVPTSDFGTFKASSRSDFKQLGTAKLGQVVTVSLGSTVSDVGGYVGTAPCTKPPARANCLKPVQVNAFDTHNVLPFHAAHRFSLFLFDLNSGVTFGPLFGSLDQ